MTDKLVIDDYPRGPGSDLLCELMATSADVFANHPVNDARRQGNKLPATHVWLWGLGQAPLLESFSTRYGKRGKMITAVDLLRGMAKLIGWDVVRVPGATGYLDTDYRAKGQYAVEALQTCDMVCVHVEAPDEASHEGNVREKIEALQNIDEHIVAPLLKALRAHGNFRILVSPDHPTPVRTKTHSHGFVPFAICGTGISPDSQRTYDEITAGQAPLVFHEGFRLMDFFMGVSG